MGLVIGDLTSQLSSNVYQNGNDHYVKRRLRVRHYHHYVDDSAYVAATKEELEQIATAVDTHLQRVCGMHIPPHKVHFYHVWNTRTKTGDTIPFLSGRVHAYYSYLSKRTTSNYLRFCAHPPEDSLQRWQAVNSYIGQMRHYHAARLTRQQ